MSTSHRSARHPAIRQDRHAPARGIPDPYEALADQGSWRGTVPEADWAGVEQNADNAGGLTLDTLRGEAFIDRA